MPQQAAVYGKLTVAENLRLFARLEKVADPEATVERMLDLTGLRDRADDQVAELSGGNRQRVNIAVGLLGEQPVLLLDEPSAALDPRQRERVWEFVLSLAEGGTTVVYSTHNIQEAERHAQRVLVLADGELLFTGSPRELEDTVERETGGRGTDFEEAFVAFLRRARPLDALAAAEGPADPAPLAAAGGAAGALPGGHRDADRLRALARARQARGGVREPRAGVGQRDLAGRRARRPLRAGRPAVRRDRPGAGEDPRGGDPEGEGRRRARRDRDPRGHHARSSSPASSRPRSRCSTTPTTR